MAYFDYSAPEVPDFSSSIAQVGDALTQAMKRKQERERFDQEMAFKREQEQRRYDQMDAQFQYQNRLAANQERRDELRFQAEQDARNAAASERARKAATPQEAAAIAANIKVYDPHTGKLVSTGSLEKGELQNPPKEPLMPMTPEVPAQQFGDVIPDIAQALPGMPPELAARMRGKQKPEPEAGAMYGPIPSAEETRRAELQRMGTEPPSLDSGDNVEARLQAAEEERAGQEAKLRRFEVASQGYRAEDPGRFDRAAEAASEYDRAVAAHAEDMRTLPARQQQYRTDMARAEATRPYTIKTGPNDPGITFDFDTQHNAARREAAQQFLASLAGVQMTDRDRQAAQFVAAGLQTGTIKPEQASAAFQKERLQTQAEGSKASMQKDKLAEDYRRAIDVQKLKNQAPRPSIMVGEGNLNMRKFEQFQKDAERFGKRYGVTNDINGLKQLNDAVNGIGGDNAALQRGVAFQLVRSMQGSGPVTDQDIRQIRTRVAGAGGVLETWLQEMESGNLGPQEQGVLFDAVKIRLGGLKARMQQARADADKHFLRERSPYRAWVGDDFIVSELDAMFPGTQSTVDFDFTPGAPPEVNAKKKGDKNRKAAGAGGAAPSKLDEAMQ